MGVKACTLYSVQPINEQTDVNCCETREREFMDNFILSAIHEAEAYFASVDIRVESVFFIMCHGA